MVLVLLQLLVVMGAMLLLYTAARLVLANPRLLQLQDGEKRRWYEYVLLPLSAALLLLRPVVMSVQGILATETFSVVKWVFDGGLLVCSLVLFVILFHGLCPRALATIGSLVTVTAWWVWPSWLTVDAFAVIAVLVLMSALLRFGIKFPWVVLLAGHFMLRDAYGIIATSRMEQAVKAELAQARPKPKSFLVPAHWQLDLQPLFGVGVMDIAIPGIIVVVAGVYGYRNGGRGAILTSGLIGYAIGLTASLVVGQVTGSPQAAMLYICPAVVVSIVLTAWRQGLLDGLWRHSQWLNSQLRSSKAKASAAS